MSKHLFNIAIGDYFGMGHGRCEQFLATANNPVETVREANAHIIEKTGIDLASFAIEFQDSLLPESVRQKLMEMGYKFQHELFEDEDGLHFFTAKTLCDCPEELVSIWVFLLNQADPELHCELVNPLPVLAADYDQPSIGYGIVHI